MSFGIGGGPESGTPVVPPVLVPLLLSPVVPPVVEPPVELELEDEDDVVVLPPVVWFGGIW
jgi:hypothetical protein